MPSLSKTLLAAIALVTGLCVALWVNTYTKSKTVEVLIHQADQLRQENQAQKQILAGMEDRIEEARNQRAVAEAGLKAAQDRLNAIPKPKPLNLVNQTSPSDLLDELTVALNRLDATESVLVATNGVLETTKLQLIHTTNALEIAKDGWAKEEKQTMVLRDAIEKQSKQLRAEEKKKWIYGAAGAALVYLVRR